MVQCPHKECEDANKDFQSDATMRQHHTMVHGEQLPNSECEICGDEFFRKGGGTYCDDCKDKEERRKGCNNANYRGGKEESSCENCGESFEYYPSEKDGLYCGECSDMNVWGKGQGGKRKSDLPDKYYKMSYDESQINSREYELPPEKRGDVSESEVKTRFLKNEISVLEPVTDNEPYDLVVESNSFIRVQVKTGRVREGCILFHSKSTHTNSNGTVRDSYVGDVDLFAVYTPEIDMIHLIRMDEIGDSKMRLRVRPPKKAVSMNRINWAKEYEFDMVVESYLNC